jgi:hypothetical protein
LMSSSRRATTRWLLRLTRPMRLLRILGADQAAAISRGTSPSPADSHRRTLATPLPTRSLMSGRNHGSPAPRPAGPEDRRSTRTRRILSVRRGRPGGTGRSRTPIGGRRRPCVLRIHAGVRRTRPVRSCGRSGSGRGESGGSASSRPRDGRGAHCAAIGGANPPVHRRQMAASSAASNNFISATGLNACQMY